MRHFLVVAALLLAFSVAGQNVTVHTENFPNIQLKITSAKKLTKEQLKLTQKGQPLEFEFIEQASQSQTSTQGASVYFLIETSGFTSNATIDNFKAGVSDFIRKAPDGVTFNASAFWKANAESKILNNLSVDFTNKKDIFVDEIKQKIQPVVDTQQQADVHKAIYDALDYISQTAPNTDKKLVILTAGVNKSYSPIKIEDCVEKALKNEIQVFSLVYKTGYVYALDNLKKLSDKTQGKSQLVSSSKEITDALEDFVKVSAATPMPQTYEVKFTLPNPQETENISLSIDGQSENIRIAAPQTSEKTDEPKSTNNQILFWVIGGVVLLAAAGGLIYRKQQQEKQKQQAEQQSLKAQLEQQQQHFLQEQQRLQQQLEQQSKPSVVQDPQKFDPKKTSIGGGGGTPTLAVSGQGFQKTFLLHKPIMTIGRKEENDIVIPIATVSSRHAVLTNEGGNWFITDQNSTNGTILNGNRIQKHILKQGDKIQLGGALLIFQL